VSSRAGRLGRRAQIVAARVLGYLSALLAVVGVVTLAKGSPGVGGLLLLAAFVLVAVAYAFVRSVARRAAPRRR
jgi:positive regulator of sigma E activity